MQVEMNFEYTVISDFELLTCEQKGFESAGKKKSVATQLRRVSPAARLSRASRLESLCLR